jgi:hypothetical protein
MVSMIRPHMSRIVVVLLLAAASLVRIAVGPASTAGADAQPAGWLCTDPAPHGFADVAADSYYKRCGWLVVGGEGHLRDLPWRIFAVTVCIPWPNGGLLVACCWFAGPTDSPRVRRCSVRRLLRGGGSLAGQRTDHVGYCTGSLLTVGSCHACSDGRIPVASVGFTCSEFTARLSGRRS